MDLETEKFTYYLDECYFHPERDKEFSTKTEKQLARKAMELLWNKPNITVNGVTYTNQDIRSKLLYEMMPEILDRAMECYRAAKDVKSETAYNLYRIANIGSADMKELSEQAKRLDKVILKINEIFTVPEKMRLGDEKWLQQRFGI